MLPCSQHQGTLAAAIPPLLARLGAPPTQKEGAVCRSAQKKEKTMSAILRKRRERATSARRTGRHVCVHVCV